MAKRSKHDEPSPDGSVSTAPQLPFTGTADIEDPFKGSGSPIPEGNGTAKPPESKGERFTRLVEFRMPKLRKAFLQVANLGNKSNYTYSEAQKEEVLAAVRRWYSNLVAAFDVPGKETESWRA